MSKDENTPTVFQLATKIGSTVVCGRHREEKLKWLIDLISTIAMLIIEFLKAFDDQTQRQIKNKLKEANFSKHINEHMEDWKPKGDLEPLLKLFLDLLLSLLHQFSPDDPDPIPPAPTPNDEIGEYTEKYIRNHILDSQKGKTAQAIANGIDQALKLMTEHPPQTLPQARAIVRQSTHKFYPFPSDEWTAFSTNLADHLEFLQQLDPELSITDILALWARIAEGCRAAAE